MPATDNATNNGSSATEDGLQWSGMDSDFRLVIMAALRSKQLLHGAAVRIGPDLVRSRNTSIALEEIKRGLVHFTTKSPEEVNAE